MRKRVFRFKFVYIICLLVSLLFSFLFGRGLYTQLVTFNLNLKSIYYLFLVFFMFSTNLAASVLLILQSQRSILLLKLSTIIFGLIFFISLIRSCFKIFVNNQYNEKLNFNLIMSIVFLSLSIGYYLLIQKNKYSETKDEILEIGKS